MSGARTIELARKVSSEQAEDEGLWVKPATAVESYLQQALRRLAAAVEGDEELVDELDPKD